MNKHFLKKLFSILVGTNIVLFFIISLQAESLPITAKIEGNAKGPVLFFNPWLSWISRNLFSDYFR